MKTKEQLYDELLILQSIEGSACAFSELVKRWEHKLFYYVRRLIQKEGDVEDILQNVWIRVFLSLKDIQDISQYRVWLFKVARSKSIDFMRKECRHRLREIPLDPEIDSLSYEDEFENKLDAQEIHRAIDRIAPAARDILTLYYLNELSIEEIGDVLDIPKGTVKSRLHYARKVLSEEVKKIYDPNV